MKLSEKAYMTEKRKVTIMASTAAALMILTYQITYKLSLNYEAFVQFMCIIPWLGGYVVELPSIFLIFLLAFKIGEDEKERNRLAALGVVWFLGTEIIIFLVALLLLGMIWLMFNLAFPIR